MEKQNDMEVVHERESDGSRVDAQALSFPEVYRMIQAGEQIPGLQKPDIKPSLQQPTVSQIPRKPKPWEK